LQVGDVYRPPIALERVGLAFLVVNERHDGGQVRLRHAVGRHALLGSAAPDHGTDLVTLDVFGDDGGAREVGAGLAAHRVASVAEAALRHEDHLAGAHLVRRVRLLRHSLRRTLRCGASLPAATLWRLRRLSGRRRRRRVLSSWSRGLRVKKCGNPDAEHDN
jgi:hypothetical protein